MAWWMWVVIAAALGIAAASLLAANWRTREARGGAAAHADPASEYDVMRPPRRRT